MQAFREMVVRYGLSHHQLILWRPESFPKHYCKHNPIYFGKLQYSREPVYPSHHSVNTRYWFRCRAALFEHYLKDEVQNELPIFQPWYGMSREATKMSQEKVHETNDHHHP